MATKCVWDPEPKEQLCTERLSCYATTSKIRRAYLEPCHYLLSTTLSFPSLFSHSNHRSSKPSRKSKPTPTKLLQKSISSLH